MGNYVVTGVRSRRKDGYVDMNPETGNPEQIAVVNNRMLTVEQYHVLARRIIGLWAPSYIKMAMLNSEDAIDYVAHLVMIGDWGYDETRCEIKTHRGNCGKLAIKNYIKSLKKESDSPENHYLDSGQGQDDPYDITADEKAVEPSERIQNSEKSEEIKRNLSMILQTLKTNQKACVIMHYIQDRSIAEIAEELDITREGARKCLAEGIKKLRKIMGANHKNTKRV